MKIAASTAVTENLLKFLANPGFLPANRRVFLGVTNVDVAPGWRTREDYICEVQVRPEYAGGPPDTGKHSQPMVFGVFPVVEAQTMDLGYSARRQFELLMDLAAKYGAAGQTAAGDLLVRYMKRIEQDIATRSPLPTLIPSSDGTQVTFRFDPTIQALANPASMRTKPGRILHARSVPALVLLVCEPEELEKFKGIKLKTSTRWIRVEYPHYLKRIWTPIWYGHLKGERSSAVDILAQVRRLDNVFGTAVSIAAIFGGRMPEDLKLSLDVVKSRYGAIETLLTGSTKTQTIPKPVHVISNAVLTAESAGGGTAAVTAYKLKIFGKNLKYACEDISVAVDGVPYSVESAGDGVIEARVGSKEAAAVLATMTNANLSVQIHGLKIEKIVNFSTHARDTIKPEQLAVSKVSPKEGFLYAKTILTIEGDGFTDVSGAATVKHVTVGGRACTILLTTPKALIVEVPPWAGFAGKNTVAAAEGPPELSLLSMAATRLSAAIKAGLEGDAVSPGAKAKLEASEKEITQLLLVFGAPSLAEYRPYAINLQGFAVNCLPATRAVLNENEPLVAHWIAVLDRLSQRDILIEGDVVVATSQSVVANEAHKVKFRPRSPLDAATVAQAAKEPAEEKKPTGAERLAAGLTESLGNMSLTKAQIEIGVPAPKATGTSSAATVNAAGGPGKAGTDAQPK
ncbi:IPT/TIG domain-containing protein [Roseimicrobium sp. ORNL1]|uniref:IPT/TIG domain-containing protein n=1 Tax=Roseimicrobium sp. ORNL1 TaxID=2711231 RepID=UPI001982046F|nr:IPT/TIG domain-containing protein [Roseimicrobium sp. ORNL1]